LAGSFILLSLALGVQGSPIFVSPWWLAFTAFVGPTCCSSGFTNVCPPGFILRKLGVPDGRRVAPLISAKLPNAGQNGTLPLPTRERLRHVRPADAKRAAPIC
jgi:hypothetical protein